MVSVTGEAGRMPVLKETLEKELSKYKGKVVVYPLMDAVSYGACQFGTMESEPITDSAQ